MSTPADPASLGRSAHGRDGQGPTAIHYPTSARQPQDDGAAFYADVLDDHPLTPDPNHPIDGAASTRFVTPPAEPLPDLPTTAAYDLHSISSEPEDAYARSVVTDGMSVTSHSRLRPATADTSRGGPRTLVDPPPVPRVHIDPSRPHPQRLPTGQRTTSSPNFRQTLSEKVMQSGYSTPPPLSRGSTNDYLSAGGNGPYKSLSAQSSSTNLVFADGDFPAPRGVFAKVMLALFTSNIIIRWFFFITPLLAILWIPGIIGVTASKDATVWGVKLIWWSAWLSVFWGGWWIGLAFAKLAPPILHYVVGTILPMLDPWFGYLSNMKKSITAFIWSLLSWSASSRHEPWNGTDPPGSLVQCPDPQPQAKRHYGGRQPHAPRGHSGPCRHLAVLRHPGHREARHPDHRRVSTLQPLEPRRRLSLLAAASIGRATRTASSSSRRPSSP